MPSKHLILCHPLLLLPSIFPSIRVFSNESALCIRWPKYWSFSFSISPSNEYSGLISFRIDWSGLISSLSRGLSRVFSKTTVQKHHFFGTQPSLYILIYYLLKPFFICFLHQSQCCFLACELSGSAHVKKLESDRKVPSKLIQALTTFF